MKRSKLKAFSDQIQKMIGEESNSGKSKESINLEILALTNNILLIESQCFYPEDFECNIGRANVAICRLFNYTRVNYAEAIEEYVRERSGFFNLNRLLSISFDNGHSISFNNEIGVIASFFNRSRNKNELPIEYLVNIVIKLIVIAWSKDLSLSECTLSVINKKPDNPIPFDLYESLFVCGQRPDRGLFLREKPESIQPIVNAVLRGGSGGRSGK